MTLSDPKIASTYERLSRLPDSNVPPEIRQRVGTLTTAVELIDRAISLTTAEPTTLERVAHVAPVISAEVEQPPTTLAQDVQPPVSSASTEMFDRDASAAQARAILAQLDMQTFPERALLESV